MRPRPYLYMIASLLCITVVVYHFRETSNTGVIEGRAYPVTDDERLVAVKLAVSLHEPRFVTWGPHITRTEVEQYVWPKGRPDSAVRVVFLLSDGEGGLMERDWCFIIVEGKVGFLGFNVYGDGWKEKARMGNWPSYSKTPTAEEGLRDRERRGGSEKVRARQPRNSQRTPTQSVATPFDLRACVAGVGARQCHPVLPLGLLVIRWRRISQGFRRGKGTTFRSGPPHSFCGAVFCHFGS